MSTDTTHDKRHENILSTSGCDHLYILLSGFISLFVSISRYGKCVDLSCWWLSRVYLTGFRFNSKIQNAIIQITPSESLRLFSHFRFVYHVTIVVYRIRVTRERCPSIRHTIVSHGSTLITCWRRVRGFWINSERYNYGLSGWRSEPVSTNNRLV